MTGRFSNSRIVSAVVLGAISLSLLFAVTLFAQRSDKATVITFDVPVEIPGSNPQVLPAGTYMFKLVDSKSTPHIVQISDKDESKVYSTIMAIPAHRDAPTHNTVVTFEENGGGRPQAIQTWFYPNDINGEEFVYSHRTPVAVAAAAPAKPAPPAPAPPLERSAPAENAPPPAPPVVPQAAPAPEPAQQEAAPPPQPPAPQTAPEPAPTPAPAVQEQQPQALPHTASNLPTVLLAGILFIGLGLTLRRFSKN